MAVCAKSRDFGRDRRRKSIPGRPQPRFGTQLERIGFHWVAGEEGRGHNAERQEVDRKEEKGSATKNAKALTIQFTICAPEKLKQTPFTLLLFSRTSNYLA